MIRTFRNAAGQTQRLAVADLLNGGLAMIASLAQEQPCALVYSDPPWNPGNEKWWRRHAGAEPPTSYNGLLDAWIAAAVACSPRCVFCEQSSNDKHRGMLLDAIARTPAWTLPLLEEWTVYYGTPGSAGCRLPNKLLHFGTRPITTDPSGMASVAMTRRVFEGLDLSGVTSVCDPCMGKGMTSRLASEFGLSCIGTELNAKRLDFTIAWLLKHGYREET